jgi:hypothetical protein
MERREEQDRDEPIPAADARCGCVSESRALHKEAGAEAIAMRNAREIKA